MSSGAHMASRKLRVLLVEDTWHLAVGLKSIFEMLDIGVIGPFADVGQAEESLRSTMPDFAVVAVNPTGQALPFIHHLIGEDVRVIALSTQPLPQILSDNAAAVLSKPYTEEQLLAAVQRVLTVCEDAHAQREIGRGL